MYRPLPEEVTIKESTIDGLGLFATEDIKEGHDFGTSHVSDVRFEDISSVEPISHIINLFSQAIFGNTTLV